MEISLHQRKFALLLLLQCMTQTAQAVETKQDLPFCSGRSTIVTLAEYTAFVLDGSTSALYALTTASPVPGTMCNCTVTPTSDAGTISVELKVTTPNKGNCTKNLGVKVDPDYDFYAMTCEDHLYALENVETRSIVVSLYIRGNVVDDTYRVTIGTRSTLGETTFRVTCLSPSEITQFSKTSPTTSSTSSTSSPSPTSSSTSPGTILTTNSSGGQTSTGISSGNSNTVVIVSSIIGIGLVLMLLTICLLCFIAGRVSRKNEKEITSHPARQRIYRRVCQTFRNLTLRRPLPSPPDVASERKPSSHSDVFVTDSGPYDSIQSSIRNARMMPSNLEGSDNRSSVKSDYDYLYPVKCNAGNSDDKYITPIKDSQRGHGVKGTGVNRSRENLYINTLKSRIPDLIDTINVPEKATVIDGAGSRNSDYMEMGVKQERGTNHEATNKHYVDDVEAAYTNVKDVFHEEVNDKHSVEDDEVCYKNIKVPSSKNNAPNNTVEQCDNDSIQDVYIDMNNTGHPVESLYQNDNNGSTSEAIKDKIIRNPWDSGYMSMHDVKQIQERKESQKDKTFPNLLKLSLNSIKPKIHFSKKQKPEVKPKPKRYVRHNDDGSSEL